MSPSRGRIRRINPVNNRLVWVDPVKDAALIAAWDGFYDELAAPRRHAEATTNKRRR